MNTSIPRRIVVAAVTFGLLLPLAVSGAAKAEKKSKEAYQFTRTCEIRRTPTKNQARTGTCWDFATLSFLESELLRLGKGEHDLSEMFVVRQAYPEKAMHYVRQHGMANFGQGGQSHDTIDQIRCCGIVPEEVYSGLNIGEKRHNHSEMVTVLQGMLDGVIKRNGKKITPRWPEAFTAVLDIYLGKVPETFVYKGKTYTPQSFRDELGLPLDDYIEITSYTNYPFYRQCRLEIPDNWTQNAHYYNLPLDEMEKMIDTALQNGYSLVWDGDVSEKEFSQNSNGVAIVPAKEWEDKTKKEQEAEITEPQPEKTVTSEMRQQAFDNQTTTDDHLMHIVGMAKDQKGTKYYIIKNSWGTEDRVYNGELYMSAAYMRLKTTALMVHKKALAPELAQKLGLR